MSLPRSVDTHLEKSMRARPTYSPEFRADAVALLRRTSRSLRQTAEDLGLSSVTLKDWYNREEMAKKGKSKALGKAVPVAVLKDESAEERVARLERENAALRKEVDSLRMDREILKKAAAFFAKENE
jgi:transposase-like protein